MRRERQKLCGSYRDIQRLRGCSQTLDDVREMSDKDLRVLTMKLR